MIKAGIMGSTGYVGSELTRILYHHPEVEIKALTSRSHGNKDFSSIYQNFNIFCFSGLKFWGKAKQSWKVIKWIWAVQS